VTKEICLLTILLLAAAGVGCSTNPAAADANSQTPAQTTASPGPDNSEITTSVDAQGTRTETRTFRNNNRISKVEVKTTRAGKRTITATAKSGAEKVVDTTEDVLQATGDKVADAAGFLATEGGKAANEVGDKAEDAKDKTVSATKEAGDKAEDVKDKTVSTSKKVGEKTVEGAKTVGDKSVEGAKTVGSKTVEGAKKVGKAVKKVIP